MTHLLAATETSGVDNPVVAAGIAIVAAVVIVNSIPWFKKKEK